MLVEAALRREPGSFEAIYHEYLKLVNAVALSYGPLREKDDIIQESFLLALEKLHTLKKAELFGSWLRVLTRNVAISHLRRGKGHTFTNDEVTDPVSLSETQRVKAMSAVSMIRELDDDYRDIIMMAYAEGMSGAEIADVTGLTAGSVRVKLARGLDKLRACMAPRGNR